MIVISRFHPYRKLYYVKSWFYEGFLYLKNNLSKTLPIIACFVFYFVFLWLLNNYLFLQHSVLSYILKPVFSFFLFFLGAYVWILIFYRLLSNKWSPFRDAPPNSIEVFHTSDPKAASNVQLLLEKQQNLPFEIYPGFKDGIELLKKSKIPSVGFFIPKHQDSEAVSKRIEDFLSNLKVTN